MVQFLPSMLTPFLFHSSLLNIPSGIALNNLGELGFACRTPLYFKFLTNIVKDYDTELMFLCTQIFSKCPYIFCVCLDA